MALTPEYQSLRFTNHIKSCPTDWHHILIFTQVLTSIISIWRHHRGHFTIYTVNYQYPLTSQNTNSISHEAAHTSSPRKPLSCRTNQRASSGHVIICCHPIGPRATMTTRLLMTFIQVKQYMM